MSTSVKMDDETKSRLEELQAEIKLETGEKVTQEELLRKIVDHALTTKAEVIDAYRKTVPANEEEIEKFHSGISSSGVKTSEEDIDEILYGKG
jgi:replicative DNA helicase